MTTPDRWFSWWMALLAVFVIWMLKGCYTTTFQMCEDTNTAAINKGIQMTSLRSCP